MKPSYFFELVKIAFSDSEIIFRYNITGILNKQQCIKNFKIKRHSLMKINKIYEDFLVEVDRIFLCVKRTKYTYGKTVFLHSDFSHKVF